jgi:phosphoglycolate phosphatase-like HAD superfamily hydrolase
MHIDQIREKLREMAMATPVIDAHTHVQDDITGFTSELAAGNLAGTQASVNRPPKRVVDEGIRRGRLARRTMTDATHGLFYSWFAQIVEGAGNRLDDAIARIGTNTVEERRAAGRFLIEQLRDSRYSEYAQWLRYMFRLYKGVPSDIDPLDPANFNRVAEAIDSERHDPRFADAILKNHNVVAYVTSIENRDKVPPAPPVRPKDVDLSYCTHPESWNMFDFNGFIWPERATDFGLFTQGHKFQAEKYIVHLEEYLEREIKNVHTLQDATRAFFWRILRSPKSNPNSRILYVDGFQAHDWRFSRPYSKATVDWAIAHHRTQLDGQTRAQVIACVAEAMLEAMNDIGKERKDAGARFGVCMQLCGGARHFMDWAREIQSIPEYIPNLPQDEYPVWIRYPHVHFEYISAHEMLYNDMANAAKQVGNLSAGPWWHYFRRHKIARMVRDQLSMGPLKSIACGFTDARFVEMIAAKYVSMRLGVADALAELVADRYSSMYNDFDAAAGVMKELLFTNPAAVHYIPVESAEARRDFGPFA